MTTPTDTDLISEWAPDLIARLEAATEGSRELDLAIDRLVTKERTADEHITAFREEYGREPGEGFKAVMRDSEANRLSEPRRKWTRSLDAALTLKPDGANCWGFDASPSGVEAYWSRNHVEDGHWMTTGEHKTSVSLALCIAALKALASDQRSYIRYPGQVTPNITTMTSGR